MRQLARQMKEFNEKWKDFTDTLGGGEYTT
jgi:hypothetical protein